jgi:2-keto-4-pentenoate hydratase/2-oxohepta-3-ene-1,7-dioic acid hydratase in catechol pathway
MRIATYRHQNRRAPGRLSPDGRALEGIGFNQPKYLRPGDVVRIEIAGIGLLENPVAAFGEAA